jgi:Fic family protein
LPNGAVEKEDRECYPGSAAFGRIAYDCKTEYQAETRYDELIQRAKELTEASEESKRTGKKVIRKKKKTEITLPDGKFTMKMLVAETGMSQPTLYIMLQNLVKQGVVQEVERVRVEGQRGRNTVVYSSVK